MDIHKDCYSAIDLTRQNGPHRRETLRIELTLRSVVLALTTLPAGLCLAVAGAEAWSAKCDRTDALARFISICAICCAAIGGSIGKALPGIDHGVRACRGGSYHAKQEYS
jgi:hypothetical protein